MVARKKELGMTKEEFEECKKEFFTEFCKRNGDPKNIKLVEFECLGLDWFKATIRKGSSEDWYNVRRLGKNHYEWG